MSKSNLKNLNPANEKHSIQEVVFTIHLDRTTPLARSEVIEKRIHKSNFKKEFPKFIKMQKLGFKWTAQTAEKIDRMDTTDGGFRFEQYNADGNLKYRIAAQNNEAEEEPPSWIAVNFMEYDDWKTVAQKAFDWLEKVFSGQSQLKAVAISLHYIDVLNWTSTAKIPYEDIFNQKTIYLPPRFSTEASKMNSSLAYEEKEEEFNKISKLSVSVLPNNEAKKILIENPLTIVWQSPVKILKERSLSPILKDGFRYLHEENKKVLKDILSKNVRQIIGLE